jgi:hypothetical protein
MKRSLFFLAFLGLAQAQVTWAQELGRLFFTAEQRAALDARRRARVPDTPTVAVVASPTTRVDGFVRRSGGPSTVWVNGEPLGEHGSDAPRIMRTPSAEGRVSVPVGDAGVRFSLKPGQVLDRGSGEIRDILGPGGELRVRPAQ